MKTPTDVRDVPLASEVVDGGEITVPTLVFDIMQASMANTAASVDRVIENLELTVRELRAELQLVRDRVYGLAQSPNIVNPALYERALYPAHEEIKALAEYTEAY